MKWDIGINQIKSYSDNFSLIIKHKKEFLFIDAGLENNPLIKEIPIANIPAQYIY